MSNYSPPPRGFRRVCWTGKTAEGGGPKIAVLLKDLTPPPWFQENLLDMSNRGGGGSNLTPTVSGIFTLLLVFLRNRRRWAFSVVKQYGSGLGSTNLSRILRFNFSYETDFRANSFVAQKSSEMSPLSGSSPVFVSQPLAAQTF